MNNDRSKILIESIKRLLRRGALTHLHKIINKSHAADLSLVFHTLSFANQKTLFQMIEKPELKGLIFSKLDEDSFLLLIEEINIEEMVIILESLPADDKADLVGKLPNEKSEAVLKKMEKEGSSEVKELLTYDDDTAGGIMVPDFIALKEDITAKDAIASLQKEYSDVEMPFYLYTVDEYDKLVGVCSLRQLVVVKPDTPLKKIMTTDVFYVQTNMHQEKVAKIVARYDILAVPVVDEDFKLVGIVTVDDVIDIFREEATEDILKMAGVGDEFIETKSVYRSTKMRLPWLFASCIGGIVAYIVIGHFEGSLIKFAYLAAFIPIIMGMGGNIGTQSSTIVVRGLATGHINPRHFWLVVSKELAIGCILGLIYGLLIGLVAQIQYSKGMFTLAVLLSVFSSMMVAALVGALVPMLFAKIHLDPAVATGPFVTTAVDILSVFLYFQLATTFLGL